MTTGASPAPGALAHALPWLLALALLMAGGCAAPLQRPPVQEGTPQDTQASTSPEPAPGVAPAPRPEVPTSVAVVLSADTVPYRAVADALPPGDWHRYVLDADDAASVLARIDAAGHRQAVAVGGRAVSALSATALQVVYCQVVDAPAGSHAGSWRGVAALPGFGAQLDAWRARQPALRRIGLITGPAHRGVAARLSEAAQPRALSVRHQVVETDQELLYVFQRMVPDIDGFVLYPDTSVLSPPVIRELVSYARKHGVWVLTYNRPIFELGAAILVTADPREVADQVVAALRADAADAGAGAAEAALSRVRVETAFPTGDGG